MSSRLSDIGNKATGEGIVSGTIRDGEGNPIRSAVVSLFAMQFLERHEELGRTESDASGSYLIAYPYESPRSIFVRVRTPDGLEFDSPVIFQASERETLDVVASREPARGPSEYRRLKERLERPLLEDKLSLDSLVEFKPKDLAYLSVRTSVGINDIELFRQAQTLEKELGFPAELFFGMARQGIAPNLPAILAAEPSARRRAIDAAYEARQISTEAYGKRDDLLAVLDKKALDAALEIPSDPRQITLGALFKTAAGFDESKSRSLVELYREEKGDLKKFWQRADEVFGKEQADRARFALQIGSIVKGYMPMVTFIAEKGMLSFDQLGSLTRQDWVEWVGSVGVPPGLEEQGISKEQYADIIYSGIEESFPTSVIKAQLHRFPRPDLTSRFFANNKNFDFRSTSLLVYLRENPDAITGPDAEETKRRLFSMESIYRIAPPGKRVETMEVLLSAGISSPTKIRAMGKAAFLRKVADKLPKEEAEKIYARASQAVALATLLQLRHGARFNRDLMAIERGAPDAVPEIPDWDTLFGDTDFCSCEDCQSLLSPAAYLFDLLQWLEHRESPDGSKTGFQVLVERRPDLPNLQLSCKNTNTTLPVIDLVNETLELAVAGKTSGVYYQTEGDAENLAVQPEHICEEAYVKLSGESERSKSVYPFILPFDYWLEEARSYLGLLGLDRYRVMEEFARETDDSTGRDLEVLGMSPFEAQVITRDPDPGLTAYAYWGMDSSYVDKLANVGRFAEQASPNRKDPLDFEAVLDLFRARYVQEDENETFQPSDIRFADSSCETSNATITPLVAEQLKRIDQLLRLHVRLGIPIHHLDAAIEAFGRKVSRDFLRDLANLRRVQDRLRLGFLETLSFWSNLDTRRWRSRMASQTGPRGEPVFVYETLRENPRPAEDGQASFYERVFLNLSLYSRDNLPTGLQLKPSDDEVEGVGQPIWNYTRPICAALAIDEGEFQRLVDATLGGDPKLSLDALSHLYRHVTLARALGLSIADLLSLIQLTGVAPFEGPATTLAFVDLVDEVRRSPFSIEELAFLLQDRDTEPPSLRLEKGEVEVLVRDLRAKLRAAHNSAEGPSSESLSVEELRAQASEGLRAILEKEVVDRALEIIDREQEPPEDPDEGKDPDPDEAAFFRKHLAGIFPDIEQAIRDLLPLQSPYTTPHARLSYLLPWLVRAWSRAAAASQFFSEAFGLPSHSAAVLLHGFARLPVASGDPLRGMDLVLSWDLLAPESDEAGGGPQPPPEILVNLERYLRLVSKQALVIARLGLRREDLDWVYSFAPSRGLIDLNRLPIEGPAPGDFEGWRRLARAAELQTKEFRGRLLDLLAQVAEGAWDADAFKEELATRTGWDLQELESLWNHFGYTFPHDFGDEKALVRIARAFATARKSGMKVAVLAELANTGASWSERKHTADLIRNAARSKLGDAAWFERAKTVRDKLREKQRDALAAWLIAHHGVGFKTYEDLFDHFLIDVEMSSCAKTSRIRQALSSVQLFVQRALLGLEPELRLSPEEAEEWQAMSRYRVWEANRKILLYPENWLDPELRDDKSPFFKELEDELLQSDLEPDQIDRAVMNYLGKLAEVSKLEVVGYEVEADSETSSPFDAAPKVEHVIGRTPGKPHKYFYRRRINGKRWTPWEPIPLDIAGEQVLPIVYRNVLHLFWLSTQERDTGPSEITVPKEGETINASRSPQIREFRLEWSTYSNGRWSPKKTHALPIYDRKPPSVRQESQDEFGGKSAVPPTPPALLRLIPRKNTAKYPDAVRLVVAWARPYKSSASQHDRVPIVSDEHFVYLGLDHVVTGSTPDVDRSSFVIAIPSSAIELEGQNLRGEGALDFPIYYPDGDWGAVRVFASTPSDFLLGPVSSMLEAKTSGPPMFFYSDAKYGWMLRQLSAGPKPKVDDKPDFNVGEGPRAGRHGPDFGPDPVITWSSSNILPDRIHGVDIISSVARGAMHDWGVGADRAVGGQLQELAPMALDAEVAYDFDGHDVTFRSPAWQDDVRRLLVNVKFGGFGSGLLRTLAAAGDYRSSGSIGDSQFRLDARPFSWPFIEEIRSIVARVGLLGFLKGNGSWHRQRVEIDPSTIYKPDPGVSLRPFVIDFDFDAPFSVYNWEIFFHIPLLVAKLLQRQRKFDRALEWLHCIFDPTAVVDPQDPVNARHWRLRPFADLARNQIGRPESEIEQLRAYLYGEEEGLSEEVRSSLAAQVEEWRRNPFSPHAVARLRLSSYMRFVVMVYVENLLEWGDELFRQDTIETINEAAALYVLAARILGRKPQRVEVRRMPAPTYEELANTSR